MGCEPVYSSVPATQAEFAQDRSAVQGLSLFMRTGNGQCILPALFDRDQGDCFLRIDAGDIHFSCGHHMFKASDSPGEILHACLVDAVIGGDQLYIEDIRIAAERLYYGIRSANRVGARSDPAIVCIGAPDADSQTGK